MTWTFHLSLSGPSRAHEEDISDRFTVPEEISKFIDLERVLDVLPVFLVQLILSLNPE
jgi:hypothetical protein